LHDYFAQAKGSVAIGISHGIDLILVHHHQGVGERGEGHEVANPGRPIGSIVLGHILGGTAQGLGNQLTVTVRGQAHSSLQDLPPQGLTVHQLSIVGNSEGSMGRVDHKGLAVYHLRGCCRGVTSVSNAQVALQLFDGLVVEQIVDHAHALVHAEVLGALPQTGHYSRRLLASMLQSHQSQADHLCYVQLEAEKSNLSKAFVLLICSQYSILKKKISNLVHPNIMFVKIPNKNILYLDL